MLELLADGEARTGFKSLALTHAEGKRWLIVGLGARDEFTAERARVVGAIARERTKEMSSKVLCWVAPPAAAGESSTGDEGDREAVAALVQGTMLADYRFDSFKSGQAGVDPDSPAGDGDAKPKQLQSLILVGTGDLAEVVEQAKVVSEAVNEARDLQNRPANDLTPNALAEHARSLGERDRAPGRRGGGTQRHSRSQDGGVRRCRARVRAGAGADHTALRATGRQRSPARLRRQGRDVRQRRHLAEAWGEDGRDEVRHVRRSRCDLGRRGDRADRASRSDRSRVVGATENLPSGRSVKPGDIVYASNGKTIEVNNTDAEGRLVLADCLCHAISLGAERVVDLATLTGAVIVALGSTYAGLMCNDEALARELEQAGERSGEIVWRLPLHEEYGELIKGKYGDLDNAPEGRKAGTIVGATFLSNFVGETPWAHLDIAGSAWDLGRAYVGKGASGYGVRLLVDLARGHCS